MSTKDPQLTFFEHLEELRRRLLISLTAVTLAGTGGYLASDRILALLTEPLRRYADGLYFFSPQGAFLVKLKVALLVGIIGASPVVLHQLWAFLAPGLHGHEKRAALPLAAVTSFLFVTGAVFAQFVVMPAAMRFLVGLESDSLRPMISVEEYVSFLSCMLVAFGVAFNLPVVVLSLVLAGFTDATGLNRFQKQAVVLIFVGAAVLTPGPDVASQLLLALPLLALFELSVLAAVIVGAARRRRGAAAAVSVPERRA